MTCVKVIASQSWDVFLRHGAYYYYCYFFQFLFLFHWPIFLCSLQCSNTVGSTWLCIRKSIWLVKNWVMRCMCH